MGFGFPEKIGRKQPKNRKMAQTVKHRFGGHFSVTSPYLIRILIGMEEEVLADFQGMAGITFILYGGAFAWSYSVLHQSRAILCG